MKVLKYSPVDCQRAGCIEVKDSGSTIPKEFNDEKNMLRDLFESIICVEDKYVLFKDKTTGKIREHLERVFAYELYRQWANRIQLVTNGDLIINGEIEKSPKVFDYYKSKVHKYPDLVMHSSQGNCDFQGIVCEIKTKKVTVSSFKEDIDKLNCFVCGKDEKYRFSFGVFILIGDDMNRIFNIMDETEGDAFKATFNERMNRIICVTYNHNHLEAVRFDWLIKKEDRDTLRNSI